MADATDKLEGLEQKLDARLDDLGATAEKLHEEREALSPEVEGLKEKFEQQRDAVTELQDEVDEMRKDAHARPGPSKEKIAEQLETKLSESGVEDIAKGRRRSASIELENVRTKDILADSFINDGEVIEPTRVPDVVHDPQRPTHVRDVMSIGQTSSDRIRYIQELTYNDGSASTVPSDGTTMKPESDFDLDVEDAPVRTVAHTFRVHREMLNDIPFLRSHIESRGMYGLMIEEDSQLLYGDGTGENLTGLSQNADSQFDTSLTGNFTSSPNRYDHIEVAALQARDSEFPVSTALIEPRSKTDMKLSKDADGNYLEEYDRLESEYTTVVNTAVQDDEAFVGQFQGGLAAEMFEREGVTVEVFREDRDNVLKNLVTFRIEERIALPIYLPTGIQYIDDLTFQP